eukprot:4118223-Alexandrium_andersonii.AAC.1
MHVAAHVCVASVSDCDRSAVFPWMRAKMHLPEHACVFQRLQCQVSEHPCSTRAHMECAQKWAVTETSTDSTIPSTT